MKNKFINLMRYIKENSIYILFSLVLILLPFNNLPYMNNLLKELSYSGTSYPILILIVLMLIYIIKERSIIKIKDKSLYILITFCLFAFVGFLVNIGNILNNEYKGKSGLVRFIFQFPLLIIGVLSSYTVYYFIKKYKISIRKIRRYILFSVFIAGGYSIFEVLYLLKIADTSNILINISRWIQLYARGEVYTRGVRSVTGEASYFAMYAAFVFPWIFSYIYTEKHKYKKLGYIFLNLYFIVLIFLSKSRIGLAIFIMEFTLFIIGIFLMKGNKQKKIISGVIVIGVILSAIFINNIAYKNNVTENTSTSLNISSLVKSITDKNNMSNVARFSMQKAALKMGNNNPIFGVGIGQFAFHVNDTVDKDAFRSQEVSRWLDENQPQYWPTVFSLHSRIYGETGILGVVIWAALWGVIIFDLIRTFIKLNDIFILSIITSIFGVLLACFNLDSFIYYPLWIMIAIKWVVSEQKNIDVSGGRI